MKRMMSSFFTVLVLSALSGLAANTTNNIDLSNESSGSTGIISVIASINTSENESIQNITEWYVLRDGETILSSTSKGEISQGNQTEMIEEALHILDEMRCSIRVNSCIAGCHSLPGSTYSPGYTLDRCITDCAEDC